MESFKFYCEDYIKALKKALQIVKLYTDTYTDGGLLLLGHVTE